MLYRILKPILLFILWPLVRMRIQSGENIPTGRNYIIVANHISNFDPLLLALAWPENVHFMAKEELFRIPVIGLVLKHLHMIPVRRGESDRKAIKESLDYLNKGEILALFPEGTRNKSQEPLLPFHTGAAFFAKSTEVEVLPVVITGTRQIRARFRNPVDFTVGKPVKIGDHFTGKISGKELEAFTLILRDGILELLEKKNDH